ncbi:FAD-dependent monooxygenase [Micromonospora sp. NPDC023888]|uniref:FAD-dependent monooxygenase n=1 Tax=Micromonospora sp. NPDC023888 TaxID=3155607 RepID=UPI0033FF15D5
MTADVVVAGGGPNGLMLACELRLAGLRPVVLERLPERSRAIRAEALVGRVLELIDRRGLYGQLSAGQDGPVTTPFFNFGGVPLDLRELPVNPLYLLRIPQPVLEERLGERAAELGVDLRRDHEVLGFEQDDDGVRVRVRTPDGEHEIAARYLVGCDGAHSTIRKSAGIPFPDYGDQDVVSRGADVVLPAEILGGEQGSDDILQRNSWLETPELGRVPFGYHRNDRGAYAIGSFQPGVQIVATWEWGRAHIDPAVPATVAEVAASLGRILGAEVPMSEPPGPGPHRLYRLAGDSRVAERYRSGRVFLVGDAAHVHAGINGPGLNLGLQDGVNLAWKLAAALHGWAPPGLLDTYQQERRPAAERVVMQTQAQAALMAPGANVTSLRALFGELIGNPDTLGAIAAVMAGTDLHYPAPDTTQPHPMTGRWAPDVRFSSAHGAARLADLMRGARPVLLDLTADGSVVELANGWKDRVDLVVGQDADLAVDALLVRPDGYVAWAADPRTPPAVVETDLAAALRSWFGPAA